MTLLCFLDTETTGLDPVIHAPWEVSWYIADQDPDPDARTLTLLTARTFQLTLTPDEMANADPVALQIGRFADRRLAGHVVTAEYAAATLRHDIRVAGASTPTDILLVGACPWFDDQMLARWWGGSANNRPWHYHLVDIETLIAGHVEAPPPWTYRDLLDQIGVESDPALVHTAAGDVADVITAYATVYHLDLAT